MSHTPGPWTLGGKETTLFGSGAFVVFAPNKHIVAAANPHICTAGNDQDEANARLIAAAPELLQALEYLVQVRKVECSAHPEGFDDICAYCKIRAAIAKATGGDL